MAHEAGALLLVDAAQSVPCMPVDVQALGVDFLAFSGHKMLAPFGTGVLYGREELLQEMSPFLFGGDMIATVTESGSTWNSLPWKFEAGTPDVAAGVALGGATDRRTGRRLVGAVDYLEGIGMEAVRAHEAALLDRLVTGLREISGVNLTGPADCAQRAAAVSFSVDGADPFMVAQLLDNKGSAFAPAATAPIPWLHGLAWTGRCAQARTSTTRRKRSSASWKWSGTSLPTGLASRRPQAAAAGDHKRDCAE